MGESLAIITARGGSKRIPRKNIRDFLGKPILAYSIEAALTSTCFSEVMVSTDDDEIAAIAQRYGAKVPFRRSEATSNDYASTADVISEVLDWYRNQGQNFESACCIYPTAPFVSGEVLRQAYSLLVEKKAATVFPVASFGFPIQRALRMDPEGRMLMFHPEHITTRSQDLEPAYHDAGQFYWFEVAAFCQSKKLYSDNSYPLILPESHVQDIDNEQDWQIAELKYRLLVNPSS